MKIHTVKRHSLLGGGNSKFCPILCVFFSPDYCRGFFFGRSFPEKKKFGGGAILGFVKIRLMKAVLYLWA